VTDPSVPKHLGKPGRALWRSVVAEYDLQPHQFVLLEAAGMARDRMMAAAEAIASDGLIVADRYGAAKASPAVAIERDSRLAVARCLRELALEVDGPAETARPPRIRAV